MYIDSYNASLFVKLPELSTSAFEGIFSGIGYSFSHPVLLDNYTGINQLDRMLKPTASCKPICNTSNKSDRTSNNQFNDLFKNPALINPA